MTTDTAVRPANAAVIRQIADALEAGGCHASYCECTGDEFAAEVSRLRALADVLDRVTAELTPFVVRDLRDIHRRFMTVQNGMESSMARHFRLAVETLEAFLPPAPPEGR